MSSDKTEIISNTDVDTNVDTNVDTDMSIIDAASLDIDVSSVDSMISSDINTKRKRELLYHITNESSVTDRSGQKVTHLVENLVYYSGSGIACKFYEKTNDTISKIVIRYCGTGDSYVVITKNSTKSTPSVTTRTVYTKDNLLTWLKTNEQQLGFMTEYIEHGKLITHDNNNDNDKNTIKSDWTWNW